MLFRSPHLCDPAISEPSYEAYLDRYITKIQQNSKSQTHDAALLTLYRDFKEGRIGKMTYDFVEN